MTDKHAGNEQTTGGASPVVEPCPQRRWSTIGGKSSGVRPGDGSVVLDRLRELPGGNELLAVAAEHPGEVELVGGTVRDIMLGILPRELDVVVAGDSRAFAAALAARIDQGRTERSRECDEGALHDGVRDGLSDGYADGLPDGCADSLRDGHDESVGNGRKENPRAGREKGPRAHEETSHSGYCEMTYHERFATALLRWKSGAIDIAMRRSETYPSPGALPEVSPGDAEQDLLRRDFTINAILVALAGERRATVRAAPHALEDLDARRLRVLHDASFLEDPTRVLRLARYAARLDLEVEPHTAALAAAALAGGALETVSGPRLGAQLRLAFAEPDPVKPLAALDRLGVLAAWEPGLSFDEHVVRVALEILPVDGSARVLLAASLVLELCGQLDDEETEPAMRSFLHDLELPAREGDRAFGAAVSAAFVIDHVGSTDTTADLLELAVGTPVEALALAAAVRDMEDGPSSYGRRVIEEWLCERRHIDLEVTGDDLIAAGVPEGPEVGVRLEESYKLLLEERIEPGRDAELRAALEARI
jgi:tRNA nucleotidyltransferase (CCA-adding enzyme)